MEQKKISTSFLGLVATPYKVTKAIGLCCLSNKILGSITDLVLVVVALLERDINRLVVKARDALELVKL